MGKAKAPAKPLWVCPTCRQSFVGRNMPHSCLVQSEAAFFAGKEMQRKLYRKFLAFVRKVGGPVTVNVTRTRIALQARMRFAGVQRVTKDGLVCSFVMVRPFAHPRLSRVEFIPPHYWVCSFRLKDASELDDEVAGWIAEAYEVGMQRATPVRS